MHFMPMRAKLGKPWMVGLRLELPYFPFPKTLARVDYIQNCCSVAFFVLELDMKEKETLILGFPHELVC